MNTVLVLLGFIILNIIDNALGVCTLGWHQFKNKCYHVNQDPTTWIQGMRMCELHGGKLVHIKSPSEQMYVKSLLKHRYKSNDYWIGATDWLVEGEWVWEPDGTMVNYTNWLPGQPNNGRGPNAGPTSGFQDYQNCVSMRHVDNYMWIDSNCDEYLHSICQKHVSISVTNMVPATSPKTTKSTNSATTKTTTTTERITTQTSTKSVITSTTPSTTSQTDIPTTKSTTTKETESPTTTLPETPTTTPRSEALVTTPTTAPTSIQTDVQSTERTTETKTDVPTTRKMTPIKSTPTTPGSSSQSTSQRMTSTTTRTTKVTTTTEAQFVLIGRAVY